jgi:hypothetical protein
MISEKEEAIIELANSIPFFDFRKKDDWYDLAEWILKNFEPKGEELQ